MHILSANCQVFNIYFHLFFYAPHMVEFVFDIYHIRLCEKNFKNNENIVYIITSYQYNIKIKT